MTGLEKFINARNRQIRNIVDESFERAQRMSPLTNDYFPMRQYTLWKYFQLAVKRNRAIASIVGFEGEIPYTRGGQISESTESYIKMAIGHLFTENDLKHIDELQQLGEQGMQAVVDIIYGNVEGIPPRIIDLSYLLIWKIVATGTCNWTDPRTKIKATYNYQTEASLFPAALAGTNVWSDAANANGLQDLFNLAEAFYLIHGYWPTFGQTVMGYAQWIQLKNQQSTKNAAIAMTGSAASPNDYYVTDDMMDRLLAERNIPPMYRESENGNTRYGFDDNVVVEQVTKTTTKPPNFVNTRLLPEGYVTFLIRKRIVSGDMGTNDNMLGERAFGPTLESKMGDLNRSVQSGIHVNTEELSKSPPQIRMYGTATFMPIIPDPRLLVSRKVA